MITTTIASNVTDGGLLASPTAGQMADLALYWVTHNYQLFNQLCDQLVNAAVTNAEMNQPEGALIELTITGLTAPGVGSLAPRLASQVNAAGANGQLIQGGATIAPWPNYPLAVASGDTLTVRWIKEAWWVYVIVGLVAMLLGMVLITLLTHANYTATSTTNTTGATGSGSGSPASTIGFVSKATKWVFGHLPLVGGIAIAAVVAPVVVSSLANFDTSKASLVSARNELRRAERQARREGVL